MGTDLFRIAVSREVDRSRYLRAMLSAQRTSFKRNLPRCLRPEDAHIRATAGSSATVFENGSKP